MKRILALCFATIVSTSILTGCGSSSNEQASDGKKELVISTWGLSEDILKEDVYAPFEEKYNCDIIIETGTTPERYTKLATDPNSKVDLIDLSQAKASEGFEAGLFEKIDFSQIQNADELISSAKDLIEDGSGVAYAINSIGIIYDKDAVGFEITEFADLWKPELAGKISIPDITSTFGPAIMYMASDYKNTDITTDNGEKAFEALEELKPNIVKTYSKSSDLANMFASGEIQVAIVGDFAIPTIQAAAPQVMYVSPESGTYANFNTMNINVNSKNKELAYEFINWRISNELQTQTATSLNEAPTNSTVTLTEEQALNKTYGEIAKNAKSIDYKFVNSVLSNWIEQWNRIINS